MTMDELANLARIFVIFSGGAVVGAGAGILRARARFYGSIGIVSLERAMYALLVVNVLALSYVSLTLVSDRWDEPLSWRWGLAVLIFAAKAWFFRLLNAGMLKQEAALRDCGLQGVSRPKRERLGH